MILNPHAVGNISLNISDWDQNSVTVSTQDEHVSHNKHTLFALTKMCLFGEEEDFGQINTEACIFSTLSRLTLIFYYFFEKLCDVGLNLRFLGNFWSFLGIILRVNNNNNNNNKHTFIGLMKMCLLRVDSHALLEK